MKPERVLESIEAVAPSKGWPIIGPRRGVILDEVVERHRPSSILEVWTNVGYSAIRMARHLKVGQRLSPASKSAGIWHEQPGQTLRRQGFQN